MPAKNSVPVTCKLCGKVTIKPLAKASRPYCSRECSALASRRKDLPDSNQLQELYVKQQKSLQDIADLFNCSAWTIRECLKKAGIPLRNRAEWGKLDWSNADENRREGARKRLLNWNRANTDKLKEFAHLATVASQNLKEPSGIEKKMMKALERAGIEYEFQFSVGKKFLCDFKVGNLIIECDGEYWHSQPQAQKRDKSKDAYLRKCGYTVLRFTDTQIRKDIAGCIAKIIDHICLATPE